MYCAQAFRIFAIYHIFQCIVLYVFPMYSKPMLSIDTVRIGEFSLTALPLDLVVMRTEDSLTFRFCCDEDCFTALPLGLVVMRTALQPYL